MQTPAGMTAGPGQQPETLPASGPASWQGPQPPVVTAQQPSTNLSTIFVVVAFVFVGLAIISVGVSAIYEDEDALIVSGVFWFLAFIFFILTWWARVRQS